MTPTILNLLWLIPALPLVAAGVIALLPRCQRTAAASLAISTMAVAFLLSCTALGESIARDGAPLVHNFTWLEFGATPLRLGWVLDPLSVVMLVMVTFVGSLIFIFSIGYMAHDANFTRFFCFLSLFAAAMLGVVISNNLLMLFGCWELVGLASYLLIGFWHHKPSAAAAAKKAFITTRIGDVGFFLGLLWLYSETGTLLFLDQGSGCLEASALAHLARPALGGAMALSTGISLLVFCGAVGKSGQVPLHVWLPDAMEGPTPVSALIHAATMVAAGVFLIARIYPLVAVLPAPVGAADAAPVAAMHAPATAASEAASPAHGSESHAAAAPAASHGGEGHAPATRPSVALQVVGWVGAITALFAALIAVAQTDIKRILAYSTVSQLGYMFLGLAAGGVAVGMFHLITHAFFKALLFLGAGSVIHGCHEEQDIRRMGGLWRKMPVTFCTYAIGMMALSGVPFLFSGFWSKDEILHAAVLWQPSKWPFLLAAAAALLTAFYMTRQMCFVFWGDYRGGDAHAHTHANAHAHAHDGSHSAHPAGVHESPAVMTVPLALLAAGTVLLGVIGTPVWPWFHAFLNGHAAHYTPAVDVGVLLVILASIAICATGIGLGWRLYGGRRVLGASGPDPLEEIRPGWFAVLRGRFFIDELYERSFIRWQAACARFSDWLDGQVWAGAVRCVSLAALGLAWVARLLDEYGVNLGFDGGCDRVRRSGRWLALLQDGQIQHYLRALAAGVVLLAFYLIWK